MTINSVTYDSLSRTATLDFDNLNADHYTLQVLTGVEGTNGLTLVKTYTTDFKAVSDFSPFVNISFTAGRANNATRTVSYNVVMTNKTAYNLIVPLILYVDSLQPATAQVVGAAQRPRRPVVARPLGCHPRQRADSRRVHTDQNLHDQQSRRLETQLQVRHFRHPLCQPRASLQLDTHHDRDRGPVLYVSGQRH